MYKNGLGTSAMVLGIIGAVVGWIPLLCIPALILGALAVIFGCIGGYRASNGVASNKGAAIAGIVTGGVALVLSLVGAVILANAAEQFDRDMERDGDRLERQLDKDLQDLSECLEWDPATEPIPPEC